LAFLCDEPCITIRSENIHATNFQKLAATQSGSQAVCRVLREPVNPFLSLGGMPFFDRRDSQLLP